MSQPTAVLEPTATKLRPVIDIYARLSINPDGTLESCDRQIPLCKAIIEQRGGEVGEIHVDDGLSAWKKGVYRPGWENAMLRMETGASDGLCTYHSDRLARNDQDGGRLLRVAKETGALLFTASGDFDLSNADHQTNFRIALAFAIKSSEDTSRRVKFAQSSMRGKGRGHAMTPFGFQRIDGIDVPCAPEADVIRMVARMLLDGSRWTEILEAVEATGVKPRSGKPFTIRNLTWLMLAPRMAGYIVYRGEILRQSVASETVLDEETWREVCDFLKGRSNGRGRRSRQLLTNFAVCANGHMLRANGSTRAGTLIYSCDKHCMSVVAEPLEDYVREAVIAWQSDPVNAARLAAEAVLTSAEETIAAQKVASAEAALLATIELMGAGLISPVEGNGRIEKYRRELTEARERYNEAASPERKHTIAETSAAEAWDAATVSQRRAMIRESCESITVAIVNGRRPPLSERVTILMR